jgi:hypothetical protein
MVETNITISVDIVPHLFTSEKSFAIGVLVERANLPSKQPELWILFQSPYICE